MFILLTQQSAITDTLFTVEFASLA